MRRLYIVILAVVGFVFFLGLFSRPLHRAAAPALTQVSLRSAKTVEDRLRQYGEAARARLQPAFDKRQLGYPPARLALLAIKNENVLQVYAAPPSNGFRLVRSYPILAASGHLGPKLREGDLQVPEGVYRVESLHPNSRYHLALRLDYPNGFDREQARREQRTRLGGDIMIHGDSVSVGCLAMGNRVAEDLFVLVADTGASNVTVIVAPVDFRREKTVPRSIALPPWAPELYAGIKARLTDLPPPQ
jgi:hypothetical protein